jgi:hypothetical protein
MMKSTLTPPELEPGSEVGHYEEFAWGCASSFIGGRCSVMHPGDHGIIERAVTEDDPWKGEGWWLVRLFRRWAVTEDNPYGDIVVPVHQDRLYVIQHDIYRQPTP